MSKVSIRDAAIISFVGKYSAAFIRIAYIAVLARILSPNDFGVVAVVTVFTTFFMLLANMGIGPAVIHNRQLDKSDISSIFTLTIYVGFAMGIIFALFSIPLSVFYGDRVYISIGIMLSMSLFFSTIDIVPRALLLKEHKFLLVNIRLVIVSFISAIAAVAFALLGWRYYAIVGHSILMAAATFFWNYVTTRPRFSGRIEKSSVSKIIHFSSFQFAFGIVNYFSRNLDKLLIGKYIGPAALGFYDKSYSLMLYPLQGITHVISPVLLPILSVHQDNRRYIFNQYMKVVKVLSLLGIFFSAYSYFAAEEIILILFGGQWIQAIPVFKVLSLSVWAQMVSSSSGAIFQVLGKTRLLFFAGICSSVVIISGIIVGIMHQSIYTVAVGVTFSYVITFFISYYLLVNKGFNYSVVEFYKKLLPDLLVCIIMFLSMHFIARVELDELWLSAIYKLITGGAVYLTILLVTGQYRHFMLLWKRKSKPVVSQED